MHVQFGDPPPVSLAMLADHLEALADLAGEREIPPLAMPGPGGYQERRLDDHLRYISLMLRLISGCPRGESPPGEGPTGPRLVR